MTINIPPSEKKFFTKENLLPVAVVLILLLVRMALGSYAGVVFPFGLYHDDALLVNYADLNDHFRAKQILPPQDWLLKDMGFPVFLWAVRFFGILYTDAVSLLWFGAAITTAAAFHLLTGVKNRLTLLAIYALVLFHPIFCDLWTGIRLYRNSILAPAYTMTLLMMVILFTKYFRLPKDEPIRPTFVAFQILFGCIFTWTCYIKEDGVWILATLTAVSLLCLIKYAFYNRSVKKIAAHILLLALPFAIYGIGTYAYIEVNRHCFGVAVVNNRTEGELGRFCRLIYKIDSPQRSGTYWAPADALQKAFEASETLGKNDRLTQEILHTPWFGGDIVANPIKGDFLTWVMYTALAADTGGNLAEQENYMAKVNDELEQAFADGRLPKSEKIQITSSMGGRSWHEIFALRRIVGTMYRDYLTMHGFLWGDYPKMLYEDNEPTPEQVKNIELASSLVGVDLFAINENRVTVNRVGDVLAVVYMVIQCGLFIMAAVGVIRQIKYFFRQGTSEESNKQMLAFTVAVGAFALSVVYALAIAWFMDFLCSVVEIRDRLSVFYGVGLLPMLMMVQIFGAYLFCSQSKNKFLRRIIS